MSYNPLCQRKPTRAARTCKEAMLVPVGSMLCLVDAERLNERTTVGLFFRQVTRFGDRTLVRHHDGASWQPHSWREMSDLTLRVASRLVGEGVGAGDRVVIMADNRLEWLYCDL